MTERKILLEKHREAVRRGQWDIASQYFQDAIEAGAKDLDRLDPGSGDVWRNIGRSVAAILES